MRSKRLGAEVTDRVDVATLVDAVLLVGKATPLLEDDIYLVTGMPASRSKANPHTSELKVEALSLVSPQAPMSAYRALNLNADRQLAIVLDRANSMNLDGSASVFPDPHGMSGSPVWRLPSVKNGLELPQLVAILASPPLSEIATPDGLQRRAHFYFAVCAEFYFVRCVCLP